MKKNERKSRIIARGEHSNHCHVIVGDVRISEEGGKTIIEVGEDSNAVLKHLLETEWLSGKQVWTKEHADIYLSPGRYEYIPQIEFDPYEDLIREVLD